MSLSSHPPPLVHTDTVVDTDNDNDGGVSVTNSNTGIVTLIETVIGHHVHQGCRCVAIAVTVTVAITVAVTNIVTAIAAVTVAVVMTVEYVGPAADDGHGQVSVRVVHSRPL